MPHLALQRMLLPGVDVKTMNSGKIKSGLGKDAQAQGAFDVLGTITLTGDATSLTFNGIPQTYKHLQVRGQVRRNVGLNSTAEMRFNNVTSASYSFHGSKNTTGEYSINETFMRTHWVHSNTINVADQYSAVIVDIFDYADMTKYKTIKSFGGHSMNASGIVSLYTGSFYSLDSVNSITIFNDGDIMVAGTSYTLYGIN